ncbi:hypothetical protein ASD11_01485 [Aeromicrobium sp. Root495]|uniref:DedA family protein n=1 Tax=Aeromicrobium sp. Root495 TaxID=1736550 RepID=UPI0006F2D392|nr:DedA family protein [Aeromicrobium sp. Root495]KQY58366.1 hypothetical protein ASD11_01485 [Aeromicrobium sp. Root495]
MTSVLLGFAFALAESGLGLGAFFPGEVAISGLAAGAHDHLALIALGVAVALGATAGDHLGYVVGRLGGTRLRESRLIARLGVARWDKAAELMQRRGFWAVLASRLLPLVRTVMPVVAGAAHLRYPAFAAASVLGALAWSGVWVGAGAGLAASGILGHPWVIAGVLTVGLVAVVVRWLLRHGRSHAGDPTPTPDVEPVATPGTLPCS